MMSALNHADSDSDSMDEMMIFSLTDLDNDADVEDAGGDSRCAGDSSGEDESSSLNKRKAELPPQQVMKPLVTLRERRRSKLGLGGEFSKLITNKNTLDRLQSVDSGFDEDHSGSNGSTNGSISSVSSLNALNNNSTEIANLPKSASPKVNWLRALKKIKTMKDPWEQYHIEDLTEERCKRHRYSALQKKWVVDEVKVKMEDKPFNRGAMRSCFRMKKLTENRTNWKKAHNYVAKLYIEDVEKEVYFEDVRLQMDAKLWGEEYDRHNPPKKVDIFQMSILEFVDRPGQPLYHLEHFIEGDYIKYNSNSGFVEESLRFTPQAFSHFTFERSGHQLIVVDVQGVGDLWTDPQIHTVDGKGYGDGNLGPKGMALFFHSHVCNSICKSLKLSKFDLAPSEIVAQGHFRRLNDRRHTVVKGCEQVVYGASPKEKGDLLSFLARSRTRTNSGLSDIPSEGSEGDSTRRGSNKRPSRQIPNQTVIIEEEDEEEEEENSPRSMDDAYRWTSEEEPMSPDSYGRAGSRSCFDPDLSGHLARLRTLSETSDHSFTEPSHEELSPNSELDDVISPEEEAQIFKNMNLKNHRASCVADEIKYRKQQNITTVGDSVLGQVHHEVAKYHELARFTNEDSDIDWDAALYHEVMAADLGIMEAIITVAKIHLGQQPDILANCTVPQNEENKRKGFEYLELAADLGDRASIIAVAEAFENGSGLPVTKKKSYKYAVDFYQKAINTTVDDEDGGFDAVMSNPSYLIQAKIAAMYLEGDSDLEKDPSYAGELYNEAAEAAMAAMKGRLANKYYALAEEAWAQVEEEETGE